MVDPFSEIGGVKYLIQNISLEWFKNEMSNYLLKKSFATYSTKSTKSISFGIWVSNTNEKIKDEMSSVEIADRKNKNDLKRMSEAYHSQFYYIWAPK